MDHGHQLLRLGILWRVEVDLEARTVAKLAAARREPGAKEKLVAAPEVLVRAFVDDRGVLSNRDLRHTDFSLRLRRSTDGDGGVIPQFVGRRDVGIVVRDSNEASRRPEQPARAGPGRQLAPRRANLIVWTLVPQEHDTLRW